MIVILSGGTGTPKLLQGLMEILHPKEISVIVNTSEDHWLSHGYFSPDVDTVLYTLSGIIDERTWHGINDDTYHTHNRLLKLGYNELLKIGDLDRATHIQRGNMMKEGVTLSDVISQQAKNLGIKSRVFPMSDDPVETVIHTSQGQMSFHEYLINYRGKPSISGVSFNGIEQARASAGALKAIQKSEGVIIGPSNPISSILPIVSIKKLRESLQSRRNRVAISPIILGNPVSGPADKFLSGKGYDCSSKSVADIYKGLIDFFIVENNESMPQHELEVIQTNILMKNLADKERLAKFTMDVLGLF
jgi:LPPG:FO 2-phospho-L-lactate transferase|tara:strand:+ start:364 stop:1275 length:912 start_codon:yes stop_codon:yes gene_type:complete